MNHLLSENYHLREYFLRTQEVPSQSVIRKKMSEPLAALYFNTMTPKLKVLAGLEPPLKGGGGDWYVPPQDLLEGRAVLKPLKKAHLSRLNYIGIDDICMKLVENQRKIKILDENKTLSEHDKKWRQLVQEKCEQVFKDVSAKEANKNSDNIRKGVEEFSSLYALAITNIETVLFNGAASEINRIENEAMQKMNDKYETSLKHQATALYNTFTNRLETEMVKLRGEFVETLATYHDELRNQIHDLNVEKHISIEQCRKFLECQRLACQVYVALKEKEECKKDIKLTDEIHKKKVTILSDEIAKQVYEISGRGLKEKMQLEFEIIWQKKVSQIMKYFHTFISYCLSLLPEHADFFINMEKLLLLHLDEVLENPSAESIFEEMESFKAPSPAPHPFYLFCDRSKKGELPLEKDLCPKRCTSSASHMPVIVVNKRCLYAACDNFQQFTNKVKHYIQGKRGDDMDFTDNHVYEYDVPVKYTTSQHLAELKLESSLLQILRHELADTREPIVCSVCKRPYCFCTSHAAKPKHAVTREKAATKYNVSNATSAKNISKDICEVHRTEPRIESYLKAIVPKRCTCSKTAKKHLDEHLPMYMKKVAVFDAPYYLPSYEPCSLATLKDMVRNARGGVALPIEPKDSKTRDVATQYNDEQYDNLCACLSEEMDIDNLMKAKPAELSKYYRPSITATDFDFLDSHSPTSVSDFSSASSNARCARDRAREAALEREQQKAHYLKASVNAVPELEEIFKNVASDEPATQRLRPIKSYSKKSFLVREKSVNLKTNKK